MDLLLKNKVVLVTGGASGLGAAIARALSQEQAIPVIVERDTRVGEELGSELNSGGRQCLLVQAELTSAQQCAAVIEHTVKHLGRLEALVNQADVSKDPVGLENGTPEAYVTSLQDSLLHYYNLAHYALPELKRARGGIVNIIPQAPVAHRGGSSGQASTKGAILALTREWAVELLPYSIRVNAIVPAEVMTSSDQPSLRSLPRPPRMPPPVASDIPPGKLPASRESIAAMVVFLLSARARHITGQHFFVEDGDARLDRA